VLFLSGTEPIDEELGLPHGHDRVELADQRIDAPVARLRCDAIAGLFSRTS
jgi:hypothetical protein